MLAWPIAGRTAEVAKLCEATGWDGLLVTFFTRPTRSPRSPVTPAIPRAGYAASMRTGVPNSTAVPLASS